MVRLLPLALPFPVCLSGSFNPTMVRLLRQPFSDNTLGVKFQSHNGAIAACVPALNYAMCLRFNPTMVRLLRCCVSDDVHVAYSFNPTMVRLLPRQNFGV